ncbi:hypothetical protein EI94DRAFT_1699699 [Lactarius quietus]|nr:hypothetical protein EI94DRAFT_1699699 [Lactarius quietus]
MFLSFEGGASARKKRTVRWPPFGLPTLPMPGSWSESHQDWGHIKRDVGTVSDPEVVPDYSARGIAWWIERLVGVVGEEKWKALTTVPLSVFKIMGFQRSWQAAAEPLQGAREPEACDNMEESSQIRGRSTNTFKLATKLRADVRIFNTAGDPNFNEKIQAGTFILPRHEGQQPALDSKNGEGGQY